MSTANFKAWMKSSESKDKYALAHLSKCSVGHLYDISSGRRNASYDLAVRVVLAAGKLSIISDLPKISLQDVYLGEIL